MYDKTIGMLNKIFSSLFVVALSFSSRGQLSGHVSDEAWGVGFHTGFVTIKNDKLLYPEGRKEGPYWGGLFGVDLSYSTYQPGGIRWQLEAKWTLDLFHKAIELFQGTGTDPRIDFTGFTWHKLGVNVFANDNLCIAVGGSFADYIVDIPKYANDQGDFFAGTTWQEPSGWNWTAGPCLFADYGVGDFAINFIGSYDFTYLTPKVTDDYEALTDKIDGYKTPNFMYLDLSVKHESGVYMSLNRTMMIDNGSLGNNMSRGEIKLGWKWWL